MNEIILKDKTYVFPRDAMFEQTVSSLQTPDELLGFVLLHDFLPHEFQIFIKQIKLICEKINKQNGTDSILFQITMVIRFMSIIARNYDDEFVCDRYLQTLKEQLHNEISTINLLIEYRASESTDSEKIFEMLSASMDPKKFNGPIGKKLIQYT